jgi:beta-lactamase regulating signal transducer with metallopeptidase domain
MTPTLASIADTLAKVWIAGLWQGVLFVLLGAVLLQLLPRAAAAFRHGVLIALFALSVALPWLSFHPAASTGHALRLAPWMAVGIAACWGIGFSFRAVTLFIAWQHLRSVRHNAVPFPIETIQFHHLPLDGRRLPRICTSSAVDSPLIVGFFRPVLLLPEWLAPTLGAEELRQIVLHEFEHLRRGDDWCNLLLHVALTLFPLNPALLWFNRRIGVQRELACDAAVVAATTRPIDYAASLARIAEQRLRRNTLRLALAAWGRQSELTTRVHALLEQPRSWSPRHRSLAGGGVAATLFASVLGLAHVPQLVRIESPTVAMASESADSQLPPTTSSSHNEGAFVRFVPASYHAKPAAHSQRPVAHKTVARDTRRVQQPTYEYAVAAVEESPLPQRTHAVAADHATVEAVSFQEDSAQSDAPIRAIHAGFSPTYVAVPVPNGWILIRL